MDRAPRAQLRFSERSCESSLEIRPSILISLLHALNKNLFSSNMINFVNPHSRLLLLMNTSYVKRQNFIMDNLILHTMLCVSHVFT